MNFRSKYSIQLFFKNLSNSISKKVADTFYVIILDNIKKIRRNQNN